ncbi:MAG: 3-isopropylmalate dehydrogenase [Alcanivorax borkumensis]|jgi:tartrate dehydrogenase/decarboxylase/D-malate dehydrogenase|uniref:Tartrate dehydrogenase n=1 Tax=Alcanivorax borkumensis (strain ATCC 700651 / DSM 11573 / NCIMB 13689 / SK2) TaxID=393595 RepID=Q0VS90_ALCBS|nr:MULTISPECIES: isocitrate/isopropylmalate dehydrogenase family protein [Alcanivorax]OJH06514.1 MAG: 3-isopropylmalate dehydrogenase [Alcanivorax borkumensis]EUC70035.1 3-isopropylmalate dehydrogenase [Alcanivorax sp. 97CO-5]PKG01819.1 isocitrate/isopropylmalate dehydrogenase family protein [Alcanivorax sp. 97CO-6]CAL15958.1 tartrate dehydrogenase [Alcanivorax borkumensis SK2]BAP13375.1 tartrate dehydrogenase [Alcanivorax sp. NBRC 101098]
MTKRLNIALLPGDGIGPEVMAVAEHALTLLIDRFQLPLTYTSFPWPSHAWHQQHGHMMPEDGVKQLRSFDAIILGALGDPGPLDAPDRFVLPDSISLSPLLALRKQLDLWACERPARWQPGAPQYLSDPRANDVDMLVIRENSEGEYSNQGGRLRAGTPHEVATQVEVFTASATERLIRHAFERARQRAKQRPIPRHFKDEKSAQVCLITKRNAQPFWGDLYTETFLRLAREYPDVDTHHELVDAACMKFVQCPWRFDVVVASNLHGDILTDLAAVLCGGPGLAPSANLNPEDGSIPALFEPVHGSAPDIAGKNLADPRATLLSLAMTLEWLAHHHPALGNAAQHLHDTVNADLAKEGDTSPQHRQEKGTLETGQRLYALLAQ